MRYPILFYTFWGMTTLLVGTFIVGGAHTALWLPRSLQYRRALIKEHALEGPMHVRRFRTFDRNMHLVVITSFLGLASTGMILKFSYAPGRAREHASWAVSKRQGGFTASAPC